jgi:iron(III) transport system permease protein
MSEVKTALAPAPGSTPTDVSDRSRRERVTSRIFNRRVLPLLALLLVIGYFTIGPILYLLRGTFTGEQGFTLDFMTSVYGSGRTWSIIGTTVIYAVGSALLAVFLGSTLAFIVARTNTPAKNLVIAASLVPLIIPGVLHTIAWLLLASPRIGALNAVPGLGGLDIFTMKGMIFVQGLHTAPLVFLLTLSAFRGMDPSLEEASLTSGSSVPRMLRRVTLPLARPAILGALIISIVTGLESFEVPVLLGSYKGNRVVTSEIWNALNTYPTQYGAAGAFSLGLLLLTILGVYYYSRVIRHGKRYATVTGKGFRPRTINLGRYRYAAAGFVVLYFLIAIVLPILILVYASTQDIYTKPSAETLGSMTWENYTKIIHSPTTTQALTNSALLAVGSATIVIVVMGFTAWYIARSKVRGRWLLDAVASAPMAIPSLVVGVALLFVYLRFPLPIYGTLWILLIAYITRYLPYGMRYASSAMSQISIELDEASEVSGASVFRTLRKVIFPLLAPGLMAGWIYIFIVSIRELASSLLLYSPGKQVLSILIWEQYQNGSIGGLAAVGTMLIAALVIFVAVLLTLTRKSGTSSGIQAGH